MLPTPQFSQETKRVETESQVEAVNFQVVLRCMFLALFLNFVFMSGDRVLFTRRSKCGRAGTVQVGRSGPEFNKSRLTLVMSLYLTRSIGGVPPPSSSCSCVPHHARVPSAFFSFSCVRVSCATWLKKVCAHFPGKVSASMCDAST